MSDDASALKERAAFWSIVASGLLTIGKLIAGLLSGSLALISEAGHGLIDTGATVLTYFAVQAADKPADDEHHYGHGKIEAVAALVTTGLLLALASYVLWEALHRLLGGETPPVEATPLAFGVLIISIGIDLWRYRALARIARETKSDALAADALHFSSDLVSSILVLAGLVAAWYGFKQGDTLAAIGVSVFIAGAGYTLGRRTIDTLVDAAPAGLAEQVSSVAAGVPGVVAVESVRLRPAGAAVFGEIAVGVSRTLPLDRVAAIKARVAEAIAQAVPGADVTVATTPHALDNETILERVLLIAAKRRVPVHHVTVQELDGHLSVSLDLEVDGRMSLGSAHLIASRLEVAIREELGPQTEVETHIEPLVVASLAGRNVSSEQSEAVAAALRAHAGKGAVITDVHSVRVRETEHGLVVNYHCRVDPTLDVATVHEYVDRLEQEVRSQIPAITRIVSHTEPVRAPAA